MSSFLTFCTDACRFNELFPGMDRYRVTLNSNFYAPFTREFYLSTGKQTYVVRVRISSVKYSNDIFRPLCRKLRFVREEYCNAVGEIRMYRVCSGCWRRVGSIERVPRRLPYYPQSKEGLHKGCFTNRVRYTLMQSEYISLSVLCIIIEWSICRAAIVPVISFSENDIYDQVRGGKLLRNLQEWVRNFTGVSPVLILGRGLFQYSFGLLPFRHSVTTVGKL